MYICICNAITDKQILKAQKNSHDSIDDIIQTLGVGSCCGRCVEKAEDLLIENAGVKRFNPAHMISNVNNAIS
jgi:bacterioferritin-associated ferredoxin